MTRTWAMADTVSEGLDYLTAGKWYEIISRGSEFTFLIDCDDGKREVCVWVKCPHLNGGNWHRHDGDTPPVPIIETRTINGDVHSWTEPASPDQTTYRNKATGEEIDLTPAKEARFFDNRDPFEWVAVRGADVHPVERELMEREGE